MKILVIGQRGQLAQSLKYINDRSCDYHMRLYDHTQLDITRPHSWPMTKTYDYIINCAAFTQVDNAEDDTYKDVLYATNADNLVSLLKYSQSCQAHLIHFSTDYVFNVYGVNNKITEDHQTNPINKYGMSKLKGEQILLNASRQQGAKVTIFRTSWLYSPWGKNFFTTMCSLLTRKESIQVVHDQIGTPTSSLELAAFLLKHYTLRPTHTQVYHYAGNDVMSWYDFSVQIKKAIKAECNIDPIRSKDYPTPARRPNYSALSNEKIRCDFPNYIFSSNEENLEYVYNIYNEERA